MQHRRRNGKRSSLHFERDRLAAALEALRAAHREAMSREADSRRRAAHDAARNERDAVVEELRRDYPEIERRLSQLMHRLATSDEANRRVNRSLPSDTRPLQSAEEIARGGRERFTSYQDYIAHRLTHRLRLPRFEVKPRDPDASPPTTTQDLKG